MFAECILPASIIQLLVPVTVYILPVCMMQMLLLVSVWTCGFNLFLKCVISQELIRECTPTVHSCHYDIFSVFWCILESGIFPWWESRGVVSGGEGGAGFKGRGGWKKGGWYTFPHYVWSALGLTKTAMNYFRQWRLKSFGLGESANVFVVIVFGPRSLVMSV